MKTPTIESAVASLDAQIEVLASAPLRTDIFEGRVSIHTERSRVRYLAEATAIRSALLAGDTEYLRDCIGPDSFRIGANLISD